MFLSGSGFNFSYIIILIRIIKNDSDCLEERKGKKERSVEKELVFKTS